MTIDLTSTQAAQEIYNYTKSKNWEIESLINNAGFGVFGEYAETELDEELKMVHLHITTPMKLIKLFLPKMLENNSGEILNVASIAGFQPGPLMAVYYASKSFLISFTEALARENKNSNVKIGVLCPGVTKTNFKANVSDDSDAKINALDNCPKDVAQHAIKALRGGKVVIIPSLFNKFLAFLPRVVSRNMARNIVYKIQKKNRN